jgi:hypothetical protein
VLLEAQKGPARARRQRTSKPRQRGVTNFAQELLLREEMDRVGLSLARTLSKSAVLAKFRDCPKRSMQSSWALVAQGLSA